MNPTALGTAEKTATLGRCRIFSGVGADQLGILAEMMHTERLAAGEVLFACGEASDTIYVIAAGGLDVVLPGASAAVRTLGPGELLGEYAMFTGRVRTATVKANADSVLLSLDYGRFRAFLLQFPESALALLGAAVRRLAEAERRVSD